MTLTLEVSPEIAKRLEFVQRSEVDLETVLLFGLLSWEHKKQAPQKVEEWTSQLQTLYLKTKEERLEALESYFASRPLNTPLLSDEAISRESIYGER